MQKINFYVTKPTCKNRTHQNKKVTKSITPVSDTEIRSRKKTLRSHTPTFSHGGRGTPI